jgi:hypothetical protein
MKRLIAVGCCALLLKWSVTCFAQAPSITYTAPHAVTPGHSLDVRLVGENLAGATGVWTSFPATVDLAPGIEDNGADAGQVTYRFTLADDVAVGIGAVRVATGQGISSLRLMMIDDLASVAESGDNHSPSGAQELSLPVAVDGQCDAQQYDYYKLHATAGQRLSVDVVARRLGYPLDPVVRLLDASGRELAYSDDEPGVGADSRFTFEFATDGEYFLELRDIRYDGGDQHRYRLRVGNFPLATVAYPLAVQKGTSSQLVIAGAAVDGLQPLTVTPAADCGQQFSVAARFPDGQGSGFVTVVASELEEKVEFEPNDSPETATPLELPGGVNGRFQTDKDRDYYQFTARAGQRLVFTGRTRSLGSPSDLFMRLYSAEGDKLAEAEDAGKLDGVINHTFAADGVFRLMVEDLHRRGGPEHGYRVEVRPYEPGFTLAAEVDKVDAPRGGVFTVKVTATRQDYNGPIALAVEGMPGVALAGHTIAEGKNETVLKATVPAEREPGTLATLHIVGTATIDGQTVSATARTLAPLRELLAGLPFPPAALDGAIGLGIGPVFPDFFKLAGPADAVPYPRLVGSTSFTVKAERLNKFDGQINLAVEALPDGFAAEVKPIEKDEGEATVTLTGPALLGGESHTLRVVGRAEFQNQPKRVVLAELAIKAVDPLHVALLQAGPITAGHKQMVKVRITRRGGEPAVVQLSLLNLPEGLSAPEGLEIAAERNELDVELTAASDMAAGMFADVIVVASTRIKDQAVVVASRPTPLTISRGQP